MRRRGPRAARRLHVLVPGRAALHLGGEGAERQRRQRVRRQRVRHVRGAAAGALLRAGHVQPRGDAQGGPAGGRRA